MNKIPKTVWVILGLIVTVYVAWHIAYPSGTWRYKMTVAVETPEGIKTGSAVREVSAYTMPRILPEACTVCMGLAKGEAVVVDLGKRGVLFALLHGPEGVDYGYDIVQSAFPFVTPPSQPEAFVRHYRSLKTGPVVMTQGLYPMFVRFRDPKDPKTLENVIEFEDASKVWPPRYAIKKDHMEEMFGQGVTLKDVSIEMTDEPVTHLIKKYNIPSADKGLYAVPHILIPLSDFQPGD
jgi:hypothetical protein